MEKCRLRLIGLTYNQIESGVYAMILQQEGGTRRIPVIIGFPEAQSIECKLQEVVTPRPLTHDLMVNTLSAFGVSLVEVDIHRLENGVFAAELHLSDGERTRVVDSRSSGAIALAIRVGAPIYTTADVLEEAGFEPGENPSVNTRGERSRSSSKPRPTASFNSDLDLKSIDQLYEEMQRASENENYEEAARIKAEIELRKNKGESDAPGERDIPF